MAQVEILSFCAGCDHEAGAHMKVGVSACAAEYRGERCGCPGFVYDPVRAGMPHQRHDVPVERLMWESEAVKEINGMLVALRKADAVVEALELLHARVCPKCLLDHVFKRDATCSTLATIGEFKKARNG